MESPSKALWERVTGDFDLTENELVILRQAMTTADNIAALDAVVATEGVMQASPQGTRAHPALVEARLQRSLLARLLGNLKMPEDES